VRRGARHRRAAEPAEAGRLVQREAVRGRAQVDPAHTEVVEPAQQRRQHAVPVAATTVRGIGRHRGDVPPAAVELVRRGQVLLQPAHPAGDGSAPDLHHEGSEPVAVSEPPEQRLSAGRTPSRDVGVVAHRLVHQCPQLHERVDVVRLRAP
jgi:hypothetical protein